MTDVRRTACNRDCPDACSLLVEVETDADGGERAVSLRGAPEDPITRGFLCERTSRFLDRQYANDRITTPLLRRDGELVPVSWDEALDLAAAKLLAARAEYGPASILHYMSGGSLGILKPLAAHLFEQFGPVTIKRGDICSGAGDWAAEHDFGAVGQNDVLDLANSRTILIWGKNPHTSSVHLLPILRAARAGGARLIGLDPVRTRAAELCERFFAPRPGGDFAAALGMARVILDRDLAAPDAEARCEGLDEFVALARSRSLAEWAAEADLPAEELAWIAEVYATNGPANIQVGWGLGRRAHGAATVRALQSLGALTGNIGVAGGGVSFSVKRSAPFALDFLRGREVAPRTLREAALGRDLLAASDPPVRVAWITAGNPVAMLPESEVTRRALIETDFVVVVDTHPTDTTAVADLVLPTLTLLEDDDLIGSYGNHWLRVSEPALAPPGEARHELQILQDLAARLDLAQALEGSAEDWKRRLLARVAELGVDLEALRCGPVRDPLQEEVFVPRGARAGGLSDQAGASAEAFDTRVPARVPMVTQPAGAPPAVSAEWPLTLLAVSTPKAQSSQWSVTLPPGPAEVRVHPDAAPGADGELRALQSAIGSLQVRVVHDPSLRRDVALMEKGGSLRDGRCANALVQPRETDAGEGVSLYDELVRLVPLES